MNQFCLPRLKQSELKQIEDSLAMHFYITGTSFQRVEEKHLLFTFKVDPMWNCIVDENGSLMEVDELDTAALDR